MLMFLLAMSCRSALMAESPQGTRAPGGGLVFPENRLSFTAVPEDGSVSAVFQYNVAASHDVAIMSVSPDCSCTVARVSQRLNHPGQVGEITVVFTIGPLDGRQRRSVWVHTDEPGGVPYRLELDVTIQPLALVEPRVVFWSQNGPPARHIITVSASSAQNIDIESADSEHGLLKAEVVPVEAGRKYIVELTPTASELRFADIITLTVRGKTRRVSYKVAARGL